jgi:glyoxylase-like metal-dependent hydrolase (beta-lactamase superfamily II)
MSGAIAGPEMAVGAIGIQRVLELERWPFAPQDLFPEIDDVLVADAAQRLGPTLVDPATGELILVVQSYLLHTDVGVVLVDPCNGNHKPRPNLPPHHDLDTPYLARLRAAGIAPADVACVLCTHLHPDHVGWSTRLQDGRWVPTFPNARHLYARAEYEQMAALHADAPAGGVLADLAATFDDSVLPVVEAGLSTVVEADHEVADGVRLVPAPGHTPGHVVVRLDSGGRRGVVSGDVLHHPIQLDALDLAQAGDADPALAAATRRALVEACADTDVLLLPGHTAPGHIRTIGGRPTLFEEGSIA